MSERRGQRDGGREEGSVCLCMCVRERERYKEIWSVWVGGWGCARERERDEGGRMACTCI